MPKKEDKRKSSKDARVAQGRTSKSARTTRERLESPIVGVPVNVKDIKFANKPKK